MKRIVLFMSIIFLAESSVMQGIDITFQHSIRMPSHLAPPEIVAAIAWVESTMRPWVVSDKGAIGLCQLMPWTVKRYCTGDPFDGLDNAEAAGRYLGQLLSRYTLEEALAIYNTGRPDIEAARFYIAKVKYVMRRSKDA